MTSMDMCCHLVVEEGGCTIPMWHKQAGEISKKQNYSSLNQPGDALIQTLVTERALIKDFW
jgi:hypothetical protein